MKRLLIKSLNLILVVAIVFSMVCPVRADESGIHYLDLLSGGYLKFNDVQYYNMRITVPAAGKGVVYFPVMPSYALGQSEFLVYTNSSDLKLFGGSNYNIEFTKQSSPLGDKYYVFTGDLGGIGARVSFTASAGAYIYFMSAKALPYGYDNVDCVFDTTLVYNSYDVITENFTNLTSFTYEYGTVNTVHSFRIAPRAASIAGMDYVDIDFYLQNASLSSVSASIGGVALEVDHTSDILYPDGGDEFYIKANVRVDISGNTLVDDQLIIFIETRSNDRETISGNGVPEGLFHIFSIKAGMEFYTPDPEVTILNRILNSLEAGFDNMVLWFEEQTTVIVDWLNPILDKITDVYNDMVHGFNAVILQLQYGFSSLEETLREIFVSDTSDAEDFDKDVQDKADEFEDMKDTMDSVVRPDTGDVQMDYDDYVSDSDIAVAVSPLSAVLSSEIFLTMIILSLTMSTVGYVLYGKR